LNRWQQIESLFQEAVRHPVEERDAWLRDACAADDDLHREVASLLVWSKNSISLKTRNNWQAGFEDARPALRGDSSVM